MTQSCNIRLSHVEQIRRGTKNITSVARKARKRVNFRISAAPGSQIYVAGTFNNWNPVANPMHDQSGKGSFIADMLVPYGKHEYKFIANGIWITDPACQSRVADKFGSENCVIQI